MRRKIAISATAAAIALAALAAGPAPPPGAPLHSPLLGSAAAQGAKSLGGGGGGGNIASAGDRFGGLLSGWGVPALIAVSGFFLIGSLAARNFGASVGIVLITLVGLIFFTAPQSIESAAKGIAGIVF